MLKSPRSSIGVAVPSVLSPLEIRSLRIAEARLRRRLTRHAPYLAKWHREWLRTLCESGAFEDLFGHPMMYPTVRLPAWHAESIDAPIDEEWHAALTYSTVCGYLAIRLTDNAMDDANAHELRHLPLAGLLYLEFQHTYSAWFEPSHPFWDHFRQIWTRTADATVRDACGETCDAASYAAIGARKTLASRIPLMAAALRADDLPGYRRWSRILDRFDAWAQRVDDLCDWRRDLVAGRQSFLLAKARRESGAASVTSWLLQPHGVEEEARRLRRAITVMRRAAANIRSTGFATYLAWRADDLRIKSAAIDEALRGLRAVVAN
jgi:hypothetical protein